MHVLPFLLSGTLMHRLVCSQALNVFLWPTQPQARPQILIGRRHPAVGHRQEDDGKKKYERLHGNTTWKGGVEAG